MSRLMHLLAHLSASMSMRSVRTMTPSFLKPGILCLVTTCPNTCIRAYLVNIVVIYRMYAKQHSRDLMITRPWHRVSPDKVPCVVV